MSERTCPSPVELERAFWRKDAGVQVHAGACERCSATWHEIEAMSAAGREIEPAPAPADRREEIRSAVLARSALPQRAPDRRRLRWIAVAVPLAAAAAVALAWWRWPAASERRGSLLAHGEAAFMRLSDQPDEIVRLVDGSLTFKVDHLRAGERFRVMTSDAEVEVVGTAFDVTARADHLVGVRVLRGLVRVRPVGGREQLVSAGQSWAAAPPAPPPPSPPSAQLTAPPAIAPPAAAHGDRAGARAPAPPPAPPTPSMQATRAAPGAAAAPGPSAAQQAFDGAWGALRAGAFDRAADGFGRAAQLGGVRVAEDALYWQSVALARAGRSGRAIRGFEGFLATYPDSARGGEASVMLGWLLFDARDYPGAGRRFRAAVGDPSARVRTSAAEGLAALEKAGPWEK